VALKNEDLLPCCCGSRGNRRMLAVQQEPGKVTPEGEEHVRSLIQTLPVNSDMRRTLEEGGRGPGVHYPWMDAMKHQGVQQAEVRLVFSVPFRIPHIWSGRPGKLTVVPSCTSKSMTGTVPRFMFS